MGLNFGHVRLYSAFPLRKFFKESLTHGSLNLCVNGKTVSVNGSPYLVLESHCTPVPSNTNKTRKLSYHKDDRAMPCALYNNGCPENF